MVECLQTSNLKSISLKDMLAKASIPMEFPQHRFMFIGFGGHLQKDFKAELVSNLFELGGSYIENEKYNDTCTHFICIQPWPCGIQKFLGACATGKWVLTPEYIQDSYRLGKWIAERDYEWGVCKKSTVVKIHSDLPEWVKTAPKRNRMRKLVRHKLNAGLPFKKWTTCILHEDKIKRLACEEILRHGGAKVKSLNQNTYQDGDCDSILNTMTHIFSEDIPANEAHILYLENLEVRCLNLDYIRDFILKNEKPKEDDYIISVYSHDALKAPRSDTFQFLKYDFRTLKIKVERFNVEAYKMKIAKRKEKQPKSTPKREKQVKTPKSSSSKPRKGRKYKRIRSTDVLETESQSQQFTPSPNSDKSSKYENLESTPNVVFSPKSPKNFQNDSIEVPAPVELKKYPVRRRSSQADSSLESTVKKAPPKPKRETKSKRRSKDDTGESQPKRSRKKVVSEEEKQLQSKSLDVIPVVDEPMETNKEPGQFSLPVSIKVPFGKETEVESPSITSSLALSESSDKEGSHASPYYDLPRTPGTFFSEDSKPDPVEPQFFTSSSEEPFTPEGSGTFDDDLLDPVLECVKKKFPHVFLWDTEYRKNDKMRIALPEENSKETEMPKAINELFYDCIKKDKLEHAIDFFISVSAHKWYPHPKVLNKIIQFLILNPDDTNSTDKASILFNAISCNQPAVTPSLSDAYVKALCPFTTAFSQTPWNALAEIISSCILKQVNCKILLKFYLDVFDQDFEAFLIRSTDPSSDLCMKRVTCPAIIQIFWPDTEVGAISKSLEELLMFIYQALVQTKVNDTFHNLMSLLAIAAECTRLAESNCLAIGIMGLKSKDLTKNVFEKCRLLELDNAKLYSFVCSLKPCWLQTQLISELLIKLPFPTLCQTRIAEPLSLLKILECYMQPIDKTCLSPESASKFNSSKKSEWDSPLKATVVNRRNNRGETQVHVACMGNHPETLKRLLNVPGVDVNIRDFAGWTPLHEACNGGHIACVSLLLKHNPANKSTIQRLKKDPVDLLAKSNDGTTPMHDAVVNDHFDVVQCLLEKGGLSLLNVKSNIGVTPLDLIQSNRMKEVIKAFSEKNLTQKVVEKDTLVPVDSPQELHLRQSFEISWYVTLLRLLIRSYLKMTKLKEIEIGLKGVLEFAKKDVTLENMVHFLEDGLKCMKDSKIPEKELTTYSNDLNCFSDFKNKIISCKSSIIKFAPDNNKNEAEKELELLLLFL